jgi:hypothetical protein
MEKHPECDLNDASGWHSGSAFGAFPGPVRGSLDVGIGTPFGRNRDRPRTNFHALQGMTNPGCFLRDPCVVQLRPGTYKDIEAQRADPTIPRIDQ